MLLRRCDALDDDHRWLRLHRRQLGQRDLDGQVVARRDVQAALAVAGYGAIVEWCRLPDPGQLAGWSAIALQFAELRSGSF